MILIVSSDAGERNVLTTLCENRGWNCTAVATVRDVRLALQRIRPSAAVTRRDLPDGYSDDVIAALREHGLPQRVVVLLRAATPSAELTRQIDLGAFQAQRDPVRADLLSRVLAQLREHAGGERLLQEEPPAATLQFAGATFHVLERRLTRGEQEVIITPREASLLQLVHNRRGSVISYDQLYEEILGRSFRGDTSNMRVLLGLLAQSYQAIGLNLRDHLEVIPKSGYRVSAPP